MLYTNIINAIGYKPNIWILFISISYETWKITKWFVIIIEVKIYNIYY